ncbi:Plasmodium exported protein, unknown function [Plasmodium ovale wallikeri]|uniref:Pv-fam-d protein n=1 Tax=Plasmodium ovale wallikeri TaxID=864142 RepID=A0A1A9AN03_PLAOA|nr:Plasmodium exported protein, unknown function [Plasmodium ovale wallikeri]SBT57584.1 Plasmodium exported protein, unknown function [Plasmodium ovale wallikeri]
MEYQQGYTDLRGRIKNIVDEDDEYFRERLNDIKRDEYFGTHFHMPMKEDISPNYSYGSMENDEFPRKINKARHYDNFEKQNSSYEYYNNVPMKNQILENKKNSKRFKKKLKDNEDLNELLHDIIKDCGYYDIHDLLNREAYDIIIYNDKIQRRSKSRFLNFLRKLDSKLDIELSKYLKMTSKSDRLFFKHLSPYKKFVYIIRKYKVFSPFLFITALFITMICMLAYGVTLNSVAHIFVILSIPILFAMGVSAGWYYILKLINIKYIRQKYSTGKNRIKRYHPMKLSS